MGIEKLSFRNNYASEYLKQLDNSTYEACSNVTVPIGQTKKDADKGITVERTAVPPMTEKEAKKNQKNFERNQERIDNSNSTVTFIDKNAYKAAKKERKKTKKELVEQYRREGMSKKDANARAEAELNHNRYIGNKKTKEFISSHQELFYDENGNYSADRARQFARDCANISTDRDADGNYIEVENGYLSLKERRAAAEQYDVKDDVIADIAKNTGHGYEKDNTELYRGLYVAGTTALGAGGGYLIGKLCHAKATATAESEAVIKDAAGNIISSSTDSALAVAQATAAVPGAVVGGAAGLGFGLATMHKIKDKGGTEPKIYDPNPHVEEEHPEEETTPIEEETDPEPEVCILQPDQQTFDNFVDEETCSYTLKRKKNGKVETLYDAVRDGYGLKDHKEIMKYVHAIKDRYNIPYNVVPSRNTWEMPELFGRKFNCDVNVNATGNKPTKKVKTYQDNGFNANKVNNPFTKYWYEDCQGNKSETYDTSDERNEAMAKRQAELNAAAGK